MAALQPLRRQFDRLADGGRVIDLWWRDDDAIRATPALDRLLRLAAERHAPLALAVVPAAIEPSLVERVGTRDDVAILVHGLSHANHAPPGEKPTEFGPHRPLAALIGDAGEGLERASVAFGPAALPVFVPPWNRLAPGLIPQLSGLGYRGLSAFGRYGEDVTAPRLARLDTHLDPVDWRGARSLVDPERLAAAFRDAAANAPAGPIGLLTHHLAFDDALWGFCEGLLALAVCHPAVRLRSVVNLIDVEPRGRQPHSPCTTVRHGLAPAEAAPA